MSENLYYPAAAKNPPGGTDLPSLAPNVPPPPYYGAQATYPARRDEKNWLGIVALITSLTGFGLLAIIFGHMGIAASDRGEASNRGMALAGTIIGYVGVLFAVLYFVFLFAVVSLSSY